MTTRHLQILPAVLLSAATALAQSYTATDLGTLGGAASQANSIGAWGVVVGVAEAKDQTYHAFVYSGHTMRDLGTFGGSASTALAVNASSQVAGYYYDAAPRPASGHPTARSPTSARSAPTSPRLGRSTTRATSSAVRKRPTTASTLSSIPAA